jgi:hypothetical protein
MIFDEKLLIELKQVYEEKMKIPPTHPKIMLEMAGGPDFANKFYEAMFAVFLSGYEHGKKG